MFHIISESALPQAAGGVLTFLGAFGLGGTHAWYGDFLEEFGDQVYL